MNVSGFNFVIYFPSRCFTVWMEGAPIYDQKWSKNEVRNTSLLLKSFNKCKPKELHRSVRGLDDVKFWKGTEFRSFLLYFGIVILKERLSEVEYVLFEIDFSRQNLLYKSV